MQNVALFEYLQKFQLDNNYLVKILLTEISQLFDKSIINILTEISQSFDKSIAEEEKII